MSEVEVRSRIAFRQKFSLGQVVATPAALKAIEDAGQTPDFFLDRHVQGDWGEVDAFDSRVNDEALANGDRILSAYRTLKGVKLWIVTEGVGDDDQRESTTILFPNNTDTREIYHGTDHSLVFSRATAKSQGQGRHRRDAATGDSTCRSNRSARSPIFRGRRPSSSGQGDIIPVQRRPGR